MSNQGQALDEYLRKNFEVIQYVHDNLAAITAVAEHLTPIEDLVQFKLEVEALYAKLALLVEASELILSASDAGIALLQAPDAAAQRLLLEIKSAALRSETYFATKAEFDGLADAVTTLTARVDEIAQQLPGLVTELELSAALQPILDRIGAIETAIGDGSLLGSITDRLDGIDGNLSGLTQTQLLLEQNLSTLDGTVTGQATALFEMSAKVTLQGEDITAQSQVLFDLNTEVSNAKLGLEATSQALQSLTTSTSIIGETVTSQSTQLTQLESEVTTQGGLLTGQGEAINSLTTLSQANAGEISSLSNETTQLASRVTDAETGIQGQALATESLTTLVTQNADGMMVLAEDVTKLESSITSVGNLLPNTAFEADLRNWTLFSRGSGWLAAELERNLEPERLPIGVSALSLTAEGVPAGNAGIQCSDVPVEGQQDYILSGYLAAENCTLSLEYRVLNSAGGQVALGWIGEVTNEGPALNLSGFTRVSKRLPIPANGVAIQVRVWVKACNTAPPKIWLVRPQLEQAVGAQQNPSPWTNGFGGMEEVLATALQSLITRTEATDLITEAVAEAVIDLSANVGGRSDWRIVTHSGVDWTTAGAPMAASALRFGEVVHGFARGMTLIRFTANGELASATRFDTFASATERANLTAALNALTQSDTFLLVTQDNHGIKDELLTAALRENGALWFNEVSPTRSYLLLSRGKIGPGNGIEVFPYDENDYLDYSFSMVNDMPRGLGENSGLTSLVVGQADALQTLTVRVTEAEGTLETVSSSVLQLDTELEDAIADISGLGTALQLLDVRVVNNADGLTTTGNALTSLSSRINGMAGDNLLINGSFETATAWNPGYAAAQNGVFALPPTWSYYGPSGTHGYHYSGSASIWIKPSASATTIYNQALIPVTAGQPITGSLRVCTVAGAAPEAGANIRLGVLWFDVNKNTLAQWSWGDWITSAGAQISYADGEINNDYIPPANAAYAQFCVYSGAFNVGSWMVDDAKAVLPNALNSALANALSELNTTVNQQGEDITANGTAITQVDGRVTGLQDSTTTALNSLQGTIELLDGEVEANAQAITQVAAGLGGGSGNLLADASFAAGTAGWLLEKSYGGTGPTLISQVAGASWQIPGTRNIGFAPPLGTGWTTGQYVNVYQPKRFAVKGTKWYIASAFLGAHRCNVQIFIYFINSSGSYIHTPASALVSGYSPTFGGTNRAAVRGQAPSTAVEAIVVIRAICTGPADPYLWITQPMVEEVAEAQLQPSPWSAGGSEFASVTEQLSATVSSVNNAFNAAYTLKLDVNNYVSGMTSTNNGTTADIAFLADNFYIASPSQPKRRLFSVDAQGTKIANDLYMGAGRIVYGGAAGGYMGVLGNGFGIGNEFVKWYGPTMAIASCSRGNAIMYETKTGVCYSKGAMFSGAITAGGQTLALNASTYTTGPFGTNGGQIIVNASFSHHRTLNASNPGATPKNNMTEGSYKTTGATIQLWRKVGTGAFAMVASAAIVGSFTIFEDGDPSIPDQGIWNITGSLNYTDNAGGTANREYELRIINETYAGYGITGTQTVPAAINNRQLSVITGE